MLEDIFKDNSYLEKALDAAWTRHQVIVNNIANVDTAGFKSSHVEFEDEFKAALEKSDFEAKRTRPGHLEFGTSGVNDVPIQIVQDKDTSMRMDGNNVDIDHEMSELAKNNIYYDTLVQKMSNQYNRLRMAINEGK
jgi:flagellar basal-body rod protein FlgB